MPGAADDPAGQGGPKFRRILASARRDLLVQATLQCLAEHGHAGVTVRRIAAVAGVSPGLINHHFPSLEALVAGAYESLATSTLDAVLAQVARAGSDPRARLRAFFVAHFSPILLDPALLNVWATFWSLIPHAPDLQAVQQRTSARFRRELEEDMAALAATEGVRGFDAPRAALALSALLDGLWLEWCLNPASFPAEHGVSMCKEWVDGHLAVAARREPRPIADTSSP